MVVNYIFTADVVWSCVGRKWWHCHPWPSFDWSV